MTRRMTNRLRFLLQRQPLRHLLSQLLTRLLALRVGTRVRRN
jgi:hypothetical protein